MRRRIAALIVGLVAVAQAVHAQKYVCVGDSITEGSRGFSNTPYLTYLGQYLESIGQTPTMVNAGVGGDTTIEALDRLPGLLSQHSDASYVLFMIGTNDIFQWILHPSRLDEQETENNYGRLIDRTRQAGMTPVLATVVPRFGDHLDPDNQHTAELNRIIERVGRNRGVSVAAVNVNLSGWVNRFTYADSLHPTHLVMPMVAEAFAAVIAGQPLASLDLTGPVPVDMAPLPGTLSAALNSELRIVLRDNRLGVDAMSIVLTVNGSAVTPTITQAGANVTVTHAFAGGLTFGQRVEVGLVAMDLSMPVRSTSLQYSFRATAGNGTNGDIDDSGRVDGRDLAIFATAFGYRAGQRGYSRDAHIDLNGVVDGMDLMVIAANFGNPV